MDILLDDAEVRILGCLIEKEMTTPEYYPLSLNALTNACNQKSNRNPVVSFTEADVGLKLNSLQNKGLAGKMLAPGSRVTKYLHAVLDRFDLSREELAVLCELMLRGPQTAGEIRSHAGRMAPLETLGDVENTLRGLADHEPPLVAKLPRETGRKECRYVQFFSGGPVAEQTGVEMLSDAGSGSATGDERISRLEEEIARLRSEVEDLRRAFTEFRSQF
jgi:uncharacterized protein